FSFVPSSPHHRHLHSFPTRRSSDLPLGSMSTLSVSPTVIPAMLVTLMFVSPAFAAAASVVCPATSPLFPLPGAALAVALQVCPPDRKSTRLNSSHQIISYAVFCLKK